MGMAGDFVKILLGISYFTPDYIRTLSMLQVNLVSDTVTKPTSGMLKAMMEAEVGDDVFRQDPTTRSLEEKMANLFGHVAAIFCPISPDFPMPEMTTFPWHS